MTQPPSATQDREHASIEQLAALLRERKLRIGASEVLDATRLVLRLGRSGRGPTTAAALRPLLRPVLCKRREDTATFDAAFDEWLRAAPLPPPPPPETPGQGEPDPRAGPPKDSSSSWRLVATLVAAIAIVALIRYLAPDNGTTPIAIDPTVAVDAGVVDGGPDKDADPRTTGVKAPAPAVEYAPVVRENRELQPAWVFAALAAALLPLVFVGLPAAVLARGRRRSGKVAYIDTSQIQEAARKIAPPLETDAADRLSRHIRGRSVDPRRLSRRPAIDLPRTLEATARSLGVPTIRYRHALLRPSYLLLIDGDIAIDPRARLFYEWAKRMMQKGWDVEVRTYRYDSGEDAASAPWTERVENSGWSEARAVRAPLDHLEDPPVGQRLLVLSDGTSFVTDDTDSDAGAQVRLRAWVSRARFKRWRDRVFFTPKQMQFWGDREGALEQPESSVDPGFLVLPLDEAALDAWSVMLSTGTLPNFTLSEPERYPRVLEGHEPNVLGSEPFPKLDDLIVELKTYLGDFGFRWLAALAVPPLCSWELTLLIGRALAEARTTSTRAGKPGELTREQTLLVSRNYRRLTQLPWLRSGHLASGKALEPGLPRWLRLRLINELSKRAQDQVREVVDRALRSAAPEAGKKGYSLEVELPPTDEPRPSVGRTEARKSGADDALYLGYMAGLSAEQLALRAPDSWASLLRSSADAKRRRGLVGTMRRLRELGRAAWSRFAFRDGLASFGVARTSAIAAGVMVAVWAIALLLLGRSKAGELPARVEQALFSTQRHAAGVNDVLVRDLRFSPDGKRLFTVDEDGTVRTLDVTDGRELALWRGPTFSVVGAQFSRDGARVMMQSRDAVEVWDVRLGKRLRSLLDVDSLRATLSGNGARVAVAEEVFDVDSGEPISAPQEASAHSVALDDRGARLGMHLFSSGVTRVVDVASGNELRATACSDQYNAPSQYCAPTLSPNGERFAIVGRDAFSLVDVASGDILTSQPREFDSPLVMPSFSANGERVAWAASQSAFVFDGVSWNKQPLALRTVGKVSGIALSDNGSTLLAWDDAAKLTIWDLLSEQRVEGKQVEPFSPTLGRFSPDAGRLAIASEAGLAARLWSRMPKNTNSSSEPGRADRDLGQGYLLDAGDFLFKDSRQWLTLAVLGLAMLLASVLDRLWLRAAVRRRQLG